MSRTTQKKHSDLRNIAVFLLIAALVVIAILVSGCSTPAVSTPDPAASAATTPEVEEPAVVDDGIYAFGEVVTFADGTSISVSAPAPFQPSEYAAGVTPGQAAIVFEFVFTNNSEKPYSPAFWNTASSGGAEASMIADMEKNIGLSPTTTILPGQTVTWQEAYSVADAANITLEVSTGFEYDSVIYTNIK